MFSEWERKPRESQEDCRAVVSEGGRSLACSGVRGLRGRGAGVHRRWEGMGLRRWMGHSREPPSPPRELQSSVTWRGCPVGWQMAATRPKGGRYGQTIEFQGEGAGNLQSHPRPPGTPCGCGHVFPLIHLEGACPPGQPNSSPGRRGEDSSEPPPLISERRAGQGEVTERACACPCQV